MINDVLEQITEDYFRHLGYFTQHNIKYKPNLSGPAYAVHSDIDIVAVHPKKRGIGRVIVASCKSWHGGIHIKRNLRQLFDGEKKLQCVYREVALPVWSKALKQKIKEITGQNKFIFYTVCVKYKLNEKNLWEDNGLFNKNLKGCPVKLLDIKTMLTEVEKKANSITPAHSELSRLVQMIYHSGGKLNY